MSKSKNDFIIFKTDDGKVSVEVRFHEETVWLTLDQMADLFERDKSTVSRHIKNIFDERELERGSVVANFATTAADRKTYQVDYYNLDVIISVGYRFIHIPSTFSRILPRSPYGYDTHARRLGKRRSSLLLHTV